jgi:hypothetical protein
VVFGRTHGKVGFLQKWHFLTENQLLLKLRVVTAPTMGSARKYEFLIFPQVLAADMVKSIPYQNGTFTLRNAGKRR